MKNIKIIPSKKVKGRLSIQVDLNKKGEISGSGYTRKIASTDSFETITVDGEDYGLMLMLTKKVPRK